MRERSPIFETRVPGAPRPGRRAMFATMLVLLVAVLAATILLPERRHVETHLAEAETDLLSQARDLQARGLFRLADARYLRAAQASHDPGDNHEAALLLADLRERELNDRAGAELALELAILSSPDEAARQSATARLAGMRKAPGASVKTSQSAPPDGTTLAATVGSTQVAVEDVMYAWGETHGPRPPDPGAFGPFVQNYLDLVLLAEEAERRGLGRRGRAALDLRMQRVVSLARALSEAMIGALPDPSEQELRAYYASTRDLWRPKRTAQARRAAAGADPAVAPDFGAAEPFEVVEGQSDFPGLGAQPGLAPILLSMEDGATTGPVRLAGGLHWFRVEGKSAGAEPPPLESIRDRVLLRYQSAALEKARQALLARLRREIPIMLSDEAFAAAPQSPTTRTATQEPSSRP